MLLGLCFFTSSINVLYRDTTQIVEFAVFVWFYLSPVLYDVYMVSKQLPASTQWLYFLNPMSGIIEWYRYALLSSQLKGSDWYSATVLRTAIPYSILFSILVFFLGYRFLRNIETRAVDEL